MAKKIPIPKTKSTTSFPLTSALMGIASIFNRRPLMLTKLQGTNPASWGSKAWRANKLANLSKMGKWATRGRLLAPALMNPWFMAPAALGFGAKYAVGKAFDPYRDETGRIGEAGHAELARAARAREALMAQRNEARQNQNAGGIARLL